MAIGSQVTAPFNAPFLPVPILAPFVAPAFPVESAKGKLQGFEERVEVLLRGPPEQAHQRVDPLLFVVTEDRGDLTLDRLLEREEQATELMGFDIEQVIGAGEATEINGQFRAGQGQRPEEPQPWTEQFSWP